MRFIELLALGISIIALLVSVGAMYESYQAYKWVGRIKSVVLLQAPDEKGEFDTGEVSVKWSGKQSGV